MIRRALCALAMIAGADLRIPVHPRVSVTVGVRFVGVDVSRNRDTHRRFAVRFFGVELGERRFPLRQPLVTSYH